MTLNKEIVINFYYTDWCKPCHKQRSILEELKKKYPKIVVNPIDQKYQEGVVIPRITIIDNDIFVKEIVGTAQLDELEKIIKKRYKKRYGK